MKKNKRVDIRLFNQRDDIQKDDLDNEYNLKTPMKHKIKPYKRIGITMFD